MGLRFLCQRNTVPLSSLVRGLQREGNALWRSWHLQEYILAGAVDLAPSLNIVTLLFLGDEETVLWRDRT